MNQVIPIRSSSLPADFTGKQIELIRRTVAKDANDDEFNMFFEVAKARGLNPFLKQIYCFIFSKDDPSSQRCRILSNDDIKADSTIVQASLALTCR